MPTLQKKIDEYNKSFKQKVPEDIQETMKQSSQKLKEQSLSKNALKVGDIIPEFTLFDSHNKLVNINNVLEHHDYLVLSFYRGSWCPFCNLELQALQKILPELTILHTQLIAISAEKPDNSLLIEERHNLQFPILYDKNNCISRDFGLVFSVDEDLRKVYDNLGIDILEANASDTFDLPMPASYIINKKHEIIFTFVDENHRNRLEPKTILATIKNNIINSH